jgi:endonuclease/exonuclease/phosphatase family metal-dependent hydrolase
MAVTLTTFNVNNLFLRYKFGQAGSEDIGGKTRSAEPGWGYLPMHRRDLFDELPSGHRDLAAQAIRDSAGGRWPEVLCLQEVESMHALRAFNDQHLEGRYTTAVLLDSRDLREIDVGLLTSLPMQSLRTHMELPDAGDKDFPWVFCRDCLEVTLHTPIGRPLVLYINHFKSKLTNESDPERRAVRVAAARTKRRRQADAVLKLFRDRFGGHADEALYAVVGDLNDEPTSVPLARLVQDAGLENVVARLPADQQWTHCRSAGTRASQLDYLLLSPGLARATHGALPRITRGGLGFAARNARGETLPQHAHLHRNDEDAQPATVDYRFPRFEGVAPGVAASEHCPVSIDLDL